MNHYIEFVALFDDGDLMAGEGFACPSKIDAQVKFMNIKNDLGINESEAKVMVDVVVDGTLEDTCFISKESFEQLTGKSLLTSSEYAQMEINK